MDKQDRIWTTIVTLAVVLMIAGRVYPDLRIQYGIIDIKIGANCSTSDYLGWDHI